MKFLSPAKVNLILRLTGRDPADGYHYLQSLFDPVSLYDTLDIKKSRIPGIRLKVLGNKLGIPPDENIVYKAIRLVMEYKKISSGIDAVLHKKIPDGAGLGGGSSNAATAILAVNRVMKLGLSMKEMQAIAFKCGSDVPFFIIRKPAVVSGKGQKIRPILRKRRLWYVIVVKKGIKIPTGDAYKWFDNENRLTERNSYSIYRSEFDSVVRGGLDPDCLALHNDFEGAVYGRYPALRGLRDDIVLHGASDALLSGSGSAVFGYFNDQTSAKKCYNAMRRRHRGSFICLVRSI